MITIENKGSDIIMFGRYTNGESYIVKDSSFKPYFYFENDYGTIPTIDGKKSTIVICNNPWEVPEKRVNYNNTYESDVVYTNRFIIDKIKELKQEPIRICYLDIEVRKGKGFSEISQAKNEILAIGCYDSFLKEYKILCIGKTHDTEKEMIKDFIKYIKNTDPDIITSWYGDGFDFPYIINRLNKLKFNVNELGRGGVCYTTKYGAKIYGRVLFDLMYGYKKLYSGEGRESWSLDFISKYEEVGEKEKYEGELDDLYKNDIDKFIRYNKKDVELLVLLNEKLGIIDFFDEVRRLCFCKFEDVFMNSKIADCLCLKYAKENGFVLPSTKKSTDKSSYEGGLVFISKPKLYKNIAVMDMKSLYPSIMIAFNTSYETYLEEDNGDCINVNNKFIFKKEEGMISAIVRPLLIERAKVDKKLKEAKKKYGKNSREYKTLWLTQYTLKIIANSFYGVLGFKKFRLYKKEVAESITYIARMIIREVSNWFKEKGYKTIYMDTDSIFIEMEESNVEDLIILNSEINNYFKKYFKQFNIYEKNNIFKLQFEYIFKTVFFKRKPSGEGVKKKYAGRIIWEDFEDVDYMLIRGFESRRSDNPHVGREMLKEVLRMIVYEEEEQKIKNYVEEFKTKIKNGSFDAYDIGLPMGLSKHPNDYGNQIHARAARNANEAHKANIQKGDKIKYIYVKDSCGVIGFKDYYWGGYDIDYEKMTRRIVDMKIGPIFESLEWEYDYILISNRKKSKKDTFESKFKQLMLWSE